MVLQTALRRIYNTGYTNETMCSRGCRGEGDEGDGTDDGRKGLGRGCCCDDLERNQRVARASAEREKERTNVRGSEGGREGEGRGLWMSGRQCRDAKGGIEVSLAPRG